jgi:hypothetical protein
MQATGNFHHQIIKLGGGIPQDLLHNMAAFDPSHHMCPQYESEKSSCFSLCLRASALAYVAFSAVAMSGESPAHRLQPPYPYRGPAERKRLGFLVTATFVVPTARIRAAEGAHEPFVHDEIRFDRMHFLCRYSGSFTLQPLWDAACAARCHQ